MAPDKAPAFQFYPRDFVGDLDVAALSLEEVGAYTLLLCYAWLKDGLPDDPAKLAKALHVTPAKFQRLWRVIAHKFPKMDDGRLRNERQERERRNQAEWRTGLSENGRKGANRRWHRPSQANGPAIAPPSPGHDGANGPPMPLQSATASASSVRTPSRARREPKVPGYTEAVKAYFQGFERRTGQKPKFGKAEGNLLAALVKDRGLDDVLAALAGLFADEWARDKGYTIGILSSQYNKFMLAGGRSRAAGPVYTIQDFDCQHDPRCGSQKRHNELLAYAAAKQGAA